MNRAAAATVKRGASALGRPVWQGAGRADVPGPSVEDAVHWARHLAPAGCGFTFGYFNADGESAAEVEKACRESIQALAALETLPAEGAQRTGYCSVKVPALGYDPGALQRLALLAQAQGQRLHFDSHGPETAEPMLEALNTLRPHHARLGLTVPGRWARSLADADWAAQHGLRVRVVNRPLYTSAAAGEKRGGCRGQRGLIETNMTTVTLRHTVLD